MARRIEFSSIERGPSTTIGSQVPGASKVVYTLRRTLKFPEGPVEQIHHLPVAAIGDAMTNFGFTAEEALEYHLMVSEASLFPNEGARTLAQGSTTVLDDPDTELLDLFEASAVAVKAALNEAQSSLRASRFAGVAPEVSEAEMADLVFGTINPEEGNAPSLRGAKMSDYAQQRSDLKNSRLADLQPNYVVNKKSPAWANATKMLSQDMQEVDVSRRAISNYRFAEVIKEAATRVIPPEPPAPQPTPEPKPEPQAKDTTGGQTQDPEADVVGLDEEGAGS